MIEIELTEEIENEAVVDEYVPKKGEGDEQDFIVRFRTLKALRDKYDYAFNNITKFPRYERDAIMEEVVNIYCTNAMRDFPILLDKIEVMMEYINHITNERNDYLARWRKAYKALGWKCSDFHDTAAFADVINKKKEKLGLLAKEEDLIEVAPPKRTRKKKKDKVVPIEPTQEQLQEVEYWDLGDLNAIHG